MKIWFYHREAQVGDAVYSDGTYSDIPIPYKKQIGVCYFVDKTDPSKRLMVGCEDIALTYWGLANNSSSISNIVLADSSGYDVYDTPIPNIAVNMKGVTAIKETETKYRDSTQPDGFAVFPSGYAESQIGFTRIGEAIRFLDKVYPANSYVPLSLVYNFYLLNHRDKILHDSSINLEVPSNSPEWTEMERLEYLLDKITRDNGNQEKYTQYYFPAFSYCHAYEPKVTENEILDEKFKAGNWMLPCIGDMERIAWYVSQQYAEDKSLAIFSKWIEHGNFVGFRTGINWTATEISNTGAWYIYVEGSYRGGFSGTGKSDKGYIRPICAF